MEFINFLDRIGEGTGPCAGVSALVYYGVYIVKVIQIIVPIALIIWGSIDLLRSIISGDEKKISAARKPFIQRLLSAVLVFLLPWLVSLVIGFASDDANADWKTCWKAAWKAGPISFDDTFDDIWN
ncbi:MAG: hypothetical protein IKZ96_04065 [Bacilli bacterium]|nr:hypothetical protein [Bacilli bacterium]